jgi:hypothetical protein
MHMRGPAMTHVVGTAKLLVMLKQGLVAGTGCTLQQAGLGTYRYSILRKASDLQ